ncbi:MAG: nuclear transport factor 2 family protein [Thermoleophilaceae bacterium]
MSPSGLESVAALLAPLRGDLVQLLGDDAFVARLRELAEPLAEPDAPVTFHAAEGVDLGRDYRGFDGLIAGWREWLSTFASYHFELEDVFQQDDRVIALVRQTGRTIHGGVDVPSSPSAAVFTLREGRVAEAAFYLDRAQAARAEGFELP